MPEIDMKSDYKFILIRGYSAGIFGESYLLAAASTSDDKVFGIELYVLSKKVEHVGVHETIEVVKRNGKNSKLECAMKQAVCKGRSEVRKLAEHRAEKLGKNYDDLGIPNLDILKGSITLDTAIQGSLSEQLVEISRKTKVPKLKRYLAVSLTNYVGT